jgi:hypothetical protein
MSQEVGPVLKQSFKNGELRLEIVDRQKLILYQKKKNKQSKHIVSLLALHPEGKQIFQASWKFPLASIILAIVLMVGESFITDMTAGDTLLLNKVLIVAAVAIAILGIKVFLGSISRKYIFFSRHANIPLIELFVANPNKDQFQDFIGEVQSCITEVQGARNLSPNDQLIGEMRMLRRLSSEGFLSTEHYEQAKTQLLDLFGDKSQPSMQDL